MADPDRAAPRVMAILQARVSSTRLPGKVMLPILGEPMLARQIERVRRASSLDLLVVATSAEAADDPIETLCAGVGVACFRGSLDDVLDRFHAAALAFGPPEHVVRLTGDCPLADPALIDEAVTLHLESGADYTSDTVEPTYPDGLDVEVLRFAALETAWREAELPSEREHVTAYVNSRPERFRIASLTREPDLSALRWTVDEPEDLAFVTAVYERLYPADPAFGTADVLALLEREPALITMNAHHERNAGARTTREADERHLRERRG